MQRIKIYLHRKSDADLMVLKRHKTFSLAKATKEAMNMVASGEFKYIALPDELEEVDIHSLPKHENYEISFADNDKTYLFFTEHKGEANERYVGLRSDFVKNLIRGVLTGPVLSLYKDMDSVINPMFNSQEKEIIYPTRRKENNELMKLIKKSGLDVDKLKELLDNKENKPVKSETVKPKKAEPVVKPIKEKKEEPEEDFIEEVEDTVEDNSDIYDFYEGLED